MLVIHNISLPAGQFATPYVDDLFMGTIDCTAHESFADLKGLRVSAHCFIRRTGEVIQYVPFENELGTPVSQRLKVESAVMILAWALSLKVQTPKRIPKPNIMHYT